MSIKSTLRKIRIHLGKLLIDIRKTHPAKATNINKILFLRQDGKIGDYIVSSFVFRELKKQRPDIFIAVVCTKNNAYLFTGNPYIDQLFFVNKRSIIDRIKCGLNLRKLHLDALVDPTVVLRNRDLLFIRLINARINLGYLKSDYRLFNLNITDPNLHFAAIYQTALEQLGFHSINTQYDLPSDRQANRDIVSFLRHHGLTEFLCVNFFGHGSARRFKAQNIAVILKYLLENTTRSLVLLTYPDVTEQLKHIIACDDQLAQATDKIFIYENTTTIFHNIELIRYASLLISPDTATVHIAAGLNKPLIAFYSQDQQNFLHWHPNNRNTTHILRYADNVNEIRPAQILAQWLNEEAA
ncbi:MULTISPECIES: glycosyltransferase family 9 protein [Pasteurellaceae]|uniref:glycosyltransferase family 9 protein n=1 Tax=Pasteurellaceae TaxID=712 RepID=UPI003567D505